MNRLSDTKESNIYTEHPFIMLITQAKTLNAPVFSVSKDLEKRLGPWAGILESFIQAMTLYYGKEYVAASKEYRSVCNWKILQIIVQNLFLKCWVPRMAQRLVAYVDFCSALRLRWTQSNNKMMTAECSRCVGGQNMNAWIHVRDRCKCTVADPICCETEEGLWIIWRCS